MRCAICMARPMPPVSPYVPWPCSGTSTLMELALAAMTRLVALRSTTLTASSTIPTGSTTCSSPPPWEVINYEPRNPIESVILKGLPLGGDHRLRFWAGQYKGSTPGGDVLCPAPLSPLGPGECGCPSLRAVCRRQGLRGARQPADLVASLWRPGHLSTEAQ